MPADCNRPRMSRSHSAPPNVRGEVHDDAPDITHLSLDLAATRFAPDDAPGGDASESASGVGRKRHAESGRRSPVDRPGGRPLSAEESPSGAASGESESNAAGEASRGGRRHTRRRALPAPQLALVAPSCFPSLPSFGAPLAAGGRVPPAPFSSLVASSAPVPSPLPHPFVNVLGAAADPSDDSSSDERVVPHPGRSWTGPREPTDHGPCVPAQGYSYVCRALDATTAEETVAAVHAFCRDKALGEAAAMLHRLGIDVVWDPKPAGTASAEVVGRPARQQQQQQQQRRQLSQAAARDSVSGGGWAPASATAAARGAETLRSRKRLHATAERDVTRHLGRGATSYACWDGTETTAVAPSRAPSFAAPPSSAAGSEVLGVSAAGVPPFSRRPGSGGKRSRGDTDAAAALRSATQPSAPPCATGKSRRRGLTGLEGAAGEGESSCDDEDGGRDERGSKGAASDASNRRQAAAMRGKADTPVLSPEFAPAPECSGVGEEAASLQVGGQSEQAPRLDVCSAGDDAGPRLGSIPASGASARRDDASVRAATDTIALMQRATQAPDSGAAAQKCPPGLLHPAPLVHGDGSAVDVRGIPPHISHEQLFVLCCVYGNVTRIIMHGPGAIATAPSTALAPQHLAATAVYSLAAAAALACAHLDGLSLGGAVLSVRPHTTGLMAQPLVADVNFSADLRHRYTGGNRGLGIPRHAVPPTCTLHVTNLPECPPAVSSEAADAHKTALTAQLASLFGRFGSVLRVQFPPTGGSTRQAFVQLDSVQAAVEALIGLHGTAPFVGGGGGGAATSTAAGAADERLSVRDSPARHIAVSFTAATLRAPS